MIFSLIFCDKQIPYGFAPPTSKQKTAVFKITRRRKGREVGSEDANCKGTVTAAAAAAADKGSNAMAGFTSGAHRAHAVSAT